VATDAGRVNAQNQNQWDRKGPGLGPAGVDRVLARTDGVLREAFDAVTSSRSLEARRVYQEARVFQVRARGAASDLRFAPALGETNSAREAAEHALVLAHAAGRGDPPEPGRDPLAIAMDRTDAVLDRARAAAEESDNVRASARLEYALRLEMRSRNAYRAGEDRQAFLLTIEARDYAEQALRLARGY